MDSFPIIISAIAAFVATLSAGIFIKKFRNHIGIVCAFSAGFFIALSVLEIIPNIFSLIRPTQISWYEPILAGLTGFLFLFALDRVFSELHLKDHHHMARENIQPKIGLLSTMEFCSHGFIEGLAIGVSFQLQLGLGIVVAIAVISHDFCDGINTLALMLNSRNTLKSSMSMLLVDALAPVLGAVTTFFFSIQDYFLVLTLSFLAGSFLFMGGGTLLPDATRMNRPIITILFFFFGFFLVVLFTRIII